jgi:AcrR family transcriptional regulator
MLNMRTAPSEPTSPDPDRTARARIRDAAITRFAADGVAATSIRAIAAAAGVSPALVIHHFGSKDGLRAACDEHVAATIRDEKSRAMAAGPGLDPLAALRARRSDPPLLAYLARTLVDGSPLVDALVDTFVDDADAYMAEGVRTGMLRPSAHHRDRAAVLTVWSLGALVLHEHLRRVLGVDLTGPPEGMMRYFLPAAEMFTQGLLTEEAAAALAQALTTEHEEGDGS